MPENSYYTVYSASAGSGKTFSLVREYLYLLLNRSDPGYFSRILAITFTNKAAQEMKDRIIDSLQEIERGEPSPMREAIMGMTGLDAHTLSRRAGRILQNIFLNYDDLRIHTIDAFTHGIIRTFARDFHLRQDFEVTLDEEVYRKEAVIRVLDTLKEDKALSGILLGFVEHLIDEDRSWNIRGELEKFAKMLESGSYKYELSKYIDKDTSGFSRMQKVLFSRINRLNKEIKRIASGALEYLMAHSDPAWYDYRALPMFFEKVSVSADVTDELKRQSVSKRIERGKILKKAGLKHLDHDGEILRKLYDDYHRIIALGRDKIYYSLLIKAVPLTASLSSIYREMLLLLEERNEMLLGEFNGMISRHIRSHPVPYIYERLGVKLRNFFIDEMQDTSLVQWDNMKYLAGEALSAGGSLMLVGDAKQSIYRWRGGEPEQFIHLSDPGLPSDFVRKKDVVVLSNNYRSLREIVEFNNRFFKFCAGEVLTNGEYYQLYARTVEQTPVQPSGGYVRIDFIDTESQPDDAPPPVPDAVHRLVEELTDMYQPGDICILVRTNKKAAGLAEYLTGKGVEVASPESLKLNKHAAVRFIIHTLYALLYTGEPFYRLQMLYFLHGHTAQEMPLHDFVSGHLTGDENSFFDGLKELDLDFDAGIFRSYTLYEGVEYIIHAFHLNTSVTANGYLLGFSKEVFSYQQRYGGSLSGFLEFWETKKDKLALPLTRNKQAVNIMTIHKAKGLEFPVVIMAYNESLSGKGGYVWLPVREDPEWEGFDSFLVPLTKSFSYLPGEGEALYRTGEEKAVFDNLNNLYVAFTRAEERLYAVMDYKRKIRSGTYADLLEKYLKNIGVWNAESRSYSFGDEVALLSVAGEETPGADKVLYSYSLSYHDKYLMPEFDEKTPDTELHPARKGKVIHKILSYIHTREDIDLALEHYRFDPGLQTDLEFGQMREILHHVTGHPGLAPYFSEGVTVYNEREIVDSGGELHIPDRLVLLPSGKWVVIDYKTGEPIESHRKQVDHYARLLEQTGKQVDKALIVYIGDSGVRRIVESG